MAKLFGDLLSVCKWINLSSLSQNMLASLTLPEDVINGVAVAEVQSNACCQMDSSKGDVIVKINDDEITSSVNPSKHTL